MRREVSPRLAYASVGQSGDFSRPARRPTVDDDATEPQTMTFAFGVGWLYGLGLCIGPFFGTGVGLTIPGGVLAGAGGGVGVVVGIGMGSGVVWGTGRGTVQGFGLSPPMQPPFANGLPRPSDLPSPAVLIQRAKDWTEQTRAKLAHRAAQSRTQRQRGNAPLAFASVPCNHRGSLVHLPATPLAACPSPRRRALLTLGGQLTDPRWHSA